MVNFVNKDDAAVVTKSPSTNFAKRQLEKHGWTEGKGLGRDENGRANAIKVSKKNNTLGVGYDVGAEFTNNWWDHLFNKAASKIVVEESQDGIHVSKKEVKNERRNNFWKVKGKDMYYGRFVKACHEEITPVEGKSETSTVTKKFTDEELFNACGGRTGHKSARHGHKLSGKLKRIAEQDLACIEDGPLKKKTKKCKKKKKRMKTQVESFIDKQDTASSKQKNEQYGVFNETDKIVDSSNESIFTEKIRCGSEKRSKKKKLKKEKSDDI